MDSEEYLEIGRWHGGLVGAATFLGGWIYCTSQYGFLLGFGLGWLPSGILGFVMFLLATWLWMPIDIILAIVIVIVVNAQKETKPLQQTQLAPQATIVKPWEEYAQSVPPEQPKNPSPTDFQALRKKQSEKTATNTFPSNMQHTPQDLAKCLLDAANTYQIPPAVLTGIMEVANGHVGEETKPDQDYLYFMGPMHVSNRMIPVVAQAWNVDFDTAHDWLKNDGCVNVYVAAWILAQKLSESGSLYQAIGLYHSNDPTAATDYTKKVIDVMDKKGLIYHDAPMPK